MLSELRMCDHFPVCCCFCWFSVVTSVEEKIGTIKRPKISSLTWKSNVFLISEQPQTFQSTIWVSEELFVFICWEIKVKGFYLQHEIQSSVNVDLLRKTLTDTHTDTQTDTQTADQSETAETRWRSSICEGSLPFSPAGRRTEHGVGHWTCGCSHNYTTTTTTTTTTTKLLAATTQNNAPLWSGSVFHISRMQVFQNLLQFKLACSLLQSLRMTFSTFSTNTQKQH